MNRRKTMASRENSVEDDPDIVIPVIEEQVQIDKEVVESGRVNISRTVDEQVHDIAIPLNHEEVQVKRVIKDQILGQAPPPVRHEGDTMIIPVLREVMVKRLLLVEELHVTKRQVKKEEVQRVSLRKEVVKVQRRKTSGSDPDPSSDREVLRTKNK